MNEKIINFYLMASRLKDELRTGWLDVEINKDRIESVAEHVYGCFVLGLAIISEYKLELDVNKVFRMIIISELRKLHLSNNQKEQDIVKQVSSLLSEKEELEKIYNEFRENKTKEAMFVNKLCKIESDFQAKIYDLNGEFNFAKALEDINNYPGELREEIKPQVRNASDGWILYNRQFYHDDLIFGSLSDEIRKLSDLK